MSRTTRSSDQQIEDRARENQFRQEVAAAHEDPDTYAPGKTGSADPVRQVSVSVIGEGLIQLRGPIKGINMIRTMINQIDAPVGQVRVGIHTVQINGEHGDRMEKVAGRIQDYIDHSRFLTCSRARCSATRWWSSPAAGRWRHRPRRRSFPSSSSNAPTTSPRIPPPEAAAEPEAPRREIRPRILRR